jgi:hypothetical protein
MKDFFQNDKAFLGACIALISILGVIYLKDTSIAGMGIAALAGFVTGVAMGGKP